VLEQVRRGLVGEPVCHSPRGYPGPAEGRRCVYTDSVRALRRIWVKLGPTEARLAVAVRATARLRRDRAGPNWLGARRWRG
jgi:hypothetical protein